MKKLTPATIQKIKKVLPKSREDVKKGFLDWQEYVAGSNFLSDDKVIEHLPISFHEYLVINKKIHADKAWVIYCLNNFNDEHIKEIVPHALKRLAMLDYYTAQYKETGPKKRGSRKKKLSKA